MRGTWVYADASKAQVLSLWSVTDGKNRVRLDLRFHFSQMKFASCGAAGVIGLHEHSGIWERCFIDIDFQFGIAFGAGHHLRVKRRRIRTSKAYGQASSFYSRASLGDTQAQNQIAISMYGGGVEPMHIEFLDGGQRFGSQLSIENTVQSPVTDRVEHQAVLLAKNLLFLLVSEAGLGSLI